VTADGFQVLDLAPGVTEAEVREKTAAPLDFAC